MAQEIKEQRFKPEGVFDKATGEFFKREPVDCKELVATGFYGYDKPAPAAPAAEPAVVAEVAGDEPAADESIPAESGKRRPGRPKKDAN